MGRAQQEFTDHHRLDRPEPLKPRLRVVALATATLATATLVTAVVILVGIAAAEAQPAPPSPPVPPPSPGPGVVTGTTANSWILRYADDARQQLHQPVAGGGGRPKGGKICWRPNPWALIDGGDLWVEIHETKPGPEWYPVNLVCPMAGRGPANVIAYSNLGREIDVDQRVGDWWSIGTALEAFVPDRGIAHSPEGGTIAGINTYFWIDGYDGQSLTEPLPGVPIPIDVTIVLESVHWSFEGDGATAEGLGTAHAPDVHHVFRTRGPAEVTAEFVFSASFRVGNGSPQPLPRLQARETISVAITELQAVIDR